MMRTDLTFPVGGTVCAAWLYTPQDSGGATLSSAPRPIIVMAHGLAGVKEERLDAFAERFTEAGYFCLVFDYRHFGASGGRPRQLLQVSLQRADWKAAVSYARTIDGVDPDKVIVWGTSFGGGHAIVTAAQDPRIAAMIAQCPFTDGLASSLQLPFLKAVKVTGLALADLAGSLLGRDPILLESGGNPGDTALMTAPDVVPGLRGLMPDGVYYRKDVAARFALDIARSFPGRQAKNITCPAFFAICDRDSVAPPGPTRKYASQAPYSEIKLYNAGHFDIYVGKEFERNVTDQLGFLTRVAPVS